jgi:hypothetical protein
LRRWHEKEMWYKAFFNASQCFQKLHSKNSNIQRAPVRNTQQFEALFSDEEAVQREYSWTLLGHKS